MSGLIISVSGLRGIVGQSLTPDIATRYAAAFAAGLPAGPVVVTRDGRANGTLLVAPVVAGLRHGGIRNVLDGGIAATPTTGVLVRQLGCVGGVQISASHNPAEYNGLKLFSGEGRVLPLVAGRAVLDRYQSQRFAPADAAARSPSDEVENVLDPLSAHLSLVEKTVDVARIRACSFHVLLDSNHGAGSVLGRPLLEHLGCRTTVLGGAPDGQFEHAPEPTSENMAGTLQHVTSVGAAVGFCQDPDADRLALIDEGGRYVGEEYTLAVCANHVLRNSPGSVVANCATSRMIEDLAAKYDVPCFRSAVGEANVVDKMLEVGAVFGGEGNGGPIDPRVGMVRDSFVGMALVLDAMASHGGPISSLIRELPAYSIVKTKVELPAHKVTTGLERLVESFSDARPDRLDGLRLDWPDCWLLVRASNTEPIVRIIAEAPTRYDAQRLCNRATSVLQMP